jgi:hypothetical protein
MRALVLAMLALAATVTPAAAQLSGASVRTLGRASTTADCVRIGVDGPEQAADVGAAAFTVEQWLRCTDADNVPIGSDYRAAGESAAFDWINGRIFLDRDIDGTPNGSGGDWGASIHRPAAESSASVVRFGVQQGANTPLTIQGSADVCDDGWHHVAVGRDGAGALFIIVDGVLDIASTTTVAGSLAYPDGQAGGPGGDDLVWGNEKHAFQEGYRGYLDELRAWSVGRTAAEVGAARFSPLAGTTEGLELYLRLEEGSGSSLADATGRNAGAILYGEWTTSVPSEGGAASSTTTTSSTSTSSSDPEPGTTSSTSSAPEPSLTSTTSSTPTTSTTSSTTSSPAPTTSSTSSTTASSTTSTTEPSGCTPAAACDDGDPCTSDACVEDACSHTLPPGLAGARCELGRLVGAALCPAAPPRVRVERPIARLIANAAQLLDAAAAAGADRPRGRRKTAVATTKVGRAAQRARAAMADGRLASDCGAAVLDVLGRAEGTLVPADHAAAARPARRATW